MNTTEHDPDGSGSTTVPLTRRAFFSRTMLAVGATVTLFGLTGCPGGDQDDGDDDGDEGDDD